MITRKLKENRIALIISAILVILFLFSFLFLKSQAASIPPNPLDDFNNKKSEVLVTGKDYKINKEQHQNHNDHIKKFKKIKEKEEEEKSKSRKKRLTNHESENTNSSGDIDTGNGDTNNNPNPNDDYTDQDQNPENENKDKNNDSEKPDESKLPTIKTNLTDGKTYNGSFKKIEVTATDYTDKYISAFSLHTEGNGEVLKSTSDNGKKVTYRLDFIDGSNEVSIKATDRFGESKIVKYTIYSDKNEEQEKIGIATFSLEASTVGLGNLIGPKKIDLYDGEQLSYIIDRVLTENGYSYSHGGTLKNGFYLTKVSKNGITNGWKIPEDLLKKLDDNGIEEGPIHENSLGERDFRKNSGWMYQVEGIFLDSGISQYIPSDGDVIRIRYTLHGGSDIGSDFLDEVWGNW